MAGEHALAIVTALPICLLYKFIVIEKGLNEYDDSKGQPSAKVKIEGSDITKTLLLEEKPSERVRQM